MNILYYGLGTNQGGIETYLYKIARNIDKSYFRLYYMDETGGKACFRKELEELGAEFFDITPRRVSITENRRDLQKLFAENKIDVLHFNCNTLSYISPILYALKYNVKVVLHSRNSKSIFFSSILHRINYFRLAFYKKEIIRKIAVSDMAGQWMFGKNGDFEVINNGVEIQRFKFDKDARMDKRNELNIKGKHVYGNVGAFLEAKNHPFLIDVFKEITETDKNAVLLLVGDGPLRASVEKRVNDLNLMGKVIFLGLRSDIPQLMMAMDCLIFPSLYEGFPNVILEAETTGLPIIMSDLITKEVVVLDICKQLSLEALASEWAENCVKMLNEKYQRETMAEAVEQAGFSVRDEISKIENLYRR